MKNTPDHTHTPGPWIAETASYYCPEHDCYAPIVCAEAVDICELNAGLRQRDANARLIAAAPCLLGVACESLEMLDGNPSPEAIETVRAMLAHAIAKAKGETL